MEQNSVISCMSQLGISIPNEVLTPEIVFKAFNEVENKKGLTWKKNGLLFHLIEKHFKPGSVYTINVPSINSCEPCGGLGFSVEVSKIEIAVSCNPCNGTGWVCKPCNRCNGTGLKDNVPCKVCKDHPGTYIFKKTHYYEGNECEICKGKGTKKNIVSSLNPPIECKVCKGSGKNRYRAKNPVLSEEIVARLFPSKEFSIKF